MTAEINSEQLVYMLGKKQIEIEFLRSENEQLRNRVRTLEVAAQVSQQANEEADEEGD